MERDADGERMPPSLDHKVIQLKDPESNDGRRAMKCWLPRGTGPLNGVTMGEWAAASVAAFELPLGRFLRSGRESVDDSKGEPE